MSWWFTSCTIISSSSFSLYLLMMEGSWWWSSWCSQRENEWNEVEIIKRKFLTTRRMTITLLLSWSHMIYFNNNITCWIWWWWWCCYFEPSLLKSPSIPSLELVKITSPAHKERSWLGDTVISSCDLHSVIHEVSQPVAVSSVSSSAIIIWFSYLNFSP